MKRILIGSVVAAVVLFVWGFLFWGLSGVSNAVMDPVPDEAALSKTLSEALPRTGVYILPYPPAQPGPEFIQRHQAGPLAQIFYRREGTNPMSGGVFAGGFLHMLVSALVMAFALSLVLPAASGYGERVRLVLLAGLAGAIYSNLGKPIWWHQTWDYHFLSFVYDFTSWVLAGLVLAKFVRN
jgi:hypothetical protein